PEAKDIVNGRYQLWFIMTSEEIPYYYDPVTLEILGSVHSFPTPPEGAIVVPLPGFNGVPTNFIQPDAKGSVDYRETFPYDKFVRGDLPQYAHVVGSLIPHTLCKANPFRYDQTSTRPFVDQPLP